MSETGIRANIRGYTKVAGIYDDKHPEIFNDREQARLRSTIESALAAVESGGQATLDFGCGSGNLTRHFQALGLGVTAADVTPAFLSLVAERFDVATIELTDGRVDMLPDEGYDLIGMYSVLHHIPDYIGVARRLVPKIKPGGVLLMDHEISHDSFFPGPELTAFRAENHHATVTGNFWDAEHKRWQFLLRAALVPSRHLARWRKARRSTIEGDIHVYADDHIEFESLIDALRLEGMELVERMDYLHFVDGYDVAAWEKWRGHCSDQTRVIMRRSLA